MTIQDPKIAPYSINLKGSNYELLEDTNRLDKDGETIYKSIGNYSSVSNALNKISKLIIEVDVKYTIENYIAEIRETRIKLTTINS